MKYHMFICLVVFGFSSGVHAQTSLLGAEKSQKNWSTEAQLNTVSNSLSATFGPSLFYSLNNQNQMGFKFFAPLGAGDEGTTSLMAAYRYHFAEKKTSLFGEGTVGANWYSYGNPRKTVGAASLGTNLGVIHHLTEDIAFGGLAGIEWTQVALDRTSASIDPNSVYAWGRIALFGSLAF